MSLANSLFQRIADFLVRYPPFQYLSESDLIMIARKTKIKFHEKGEYIFSEGDPRGRVFFVVHSGRVRVFNQSSDKKISDYREEGDILGLSHILEEKQHHSTAEAVKDTLLYAIPWESMAEILPNYPDVVRYVRAHVSIRSETLILDIDAGEELLAPDMDSNTMVSRIGEITQVAQFVEHRFVRCKPDASMQEVAFLMQQNKVEAVIVTDKKGHPMGIVTKTDMTRLAQSGKLSSRAFAKDFMSTPVATIQENPPLGQCIRLLMKSGYQHICMTVDGTANSPAIGVISERDIMLFYGNNPMVIIRQIGEINNFEELSHIRHRADMLILNELRTVNGIYWFADVIYELNRAFMRRIVQLSIRELRQQGVFIPPADFCLFFAGKGGRKELFTRDAMDRGLVYQVTDTDYQEQTDEFFRRLTETIFDGLIKCGWTENERGLTEKNPMWCQPLEQWKAYIEQWTSSEDEEVMRMSLNWFETRYADGYEKLHTEIGDTWRTLFHTQPDYLARLKNITQKSIPNPRQFESFNLRDDEGNAEPFDLYEFALKPLVDMGRYFSVMNGIYDLNSTVERFQALAKKDKENLELFEGAEDAARFILYCIAKTGLKEQSIGNVIDPDDLTGLEIQLVKSTFRNIMELANLMETYTAR